MKPCSKVSQSVNVERARRLVCVFARKLARRGSFQSNPTPPAKAHQRKLAAPLALREHILVREHVLVREQERKLTTPLGLEAYFQKSVS